MFPRGLIHYQQNLSCKPAKYISILNNEDPGVVTVSLQTFEFPIEALSTTFNLPFDRIKSIKAGLPANIAKGREECIKRCRIYG